MSGQTLFAKEDLNELTKQAIKTAKRPVKLSFENLEYEVEIKLNPKDAREKGYKTMRQKIVKGVSGFALPG